MMQVKTVSLLGQTVSLYGLFLALTVALFSAGLVLAAPKHGCKRGGACAFCLLAAALGLLLGRAVYCAVRFEWIFYDALGDFIGPAVFFNPWAGSANVIGVIVGVILAAPLAARLTGERAAKILDLAAPFGVGVYTVARALEPLSGRGYGVIISESPLAVFPFALKTFMGEYALSVCFIECVLAFIVLVCVLVLRKKCPRPGMLALTALTLLSASQILPESLRHDDSLFIFVFARVTQIGFALLLGGCLLFAQRGKGLTKKQIAQDWALLLLGVAVCVAVEFALDKTTLPHGGIYIVMALTLCGMAAVALRRVFRNCSEITCTDWLG